MYMVVMQRWVNPGRQSRVVGLTRCVRRCRVIVRLLQQTAANLHFNGFVSFYRPALMLCIKPFFVLCEVVSGTVCRSIPAALGCVMKTYACGSS
eukprot:1068385-Amphidinium_carterae.1